MFIGQWRWRYNNFILLCEITWPHDRKITYVSPLCQLWPLKVYWKWRNKVFVLSCNMTWPNDQRDMQLGKLEPVALSLLPTKSGVFMYSKNWEITFFFCHEVYMTTSRDNISKDKYNLVSRSLLISVTILPSLKVFCLVEVEIWRFEFFIWSNKEILVKTYAH